MTKGLGVSAIDFLRTRQWRDKDAPGMSRSDQSSLDCFAELPINVDTWCDDDWYI